MDAFFAGLRPNSLVRTWAFPNLGLDNAERVVQAAERNNQMLIMSLADGRSYCGEHDGAQGGDGSGKTSSWYSSGYKGSYLSWIRQIVPHFQDSPAIGMWELLNEPGDTDVNTMKAFFDDVSAEIKSLDSNHLVETGTWPPWAYDGEEGYRSLHEGENIDVGSMHEYDYDYNNSRTILSPHFAPAISAMNSLDKPLIIGETGITAGDGCWTSRIQRRDAMQEKFDAYIDGGAAAVFVWNWFASSPGGCNHSFGPDDPIMAMIHDYPLPDPVVSVSLPFHMNTGTEAHNYSLYRNSYIRFYFTQEGFVKNYDIRGALLPSLLQFESESYLSIILCKEYPLAK
jgi:mannan endo-1,4-beta-mannosidase